MVRDLTNKLKVNHEDIENASREYSKKEDNERKYPIINSDDGYTFHDFSEGAYWAINVFSEISSDSKIEKKLLWLDDLRNPFLNTEGLVPKEKCVINWVLNYEQFTEWIEKFGLPDIISFDHDLADEHYTPEEYWHDYQLSKEYQDSREYTEKTGKDCANWLIEYCMDNNKELPICYIHSANPVGADNIRFLLSNFREKYKI